MCRLNSNALMMVGEASSEESLAIIALWVELSKNEKLECVANVMLRMASATTLSAGSGDGS